jgi:hypothetical protein
MLRVKNNPFDPSNRRISILVKNGNETVPIYLAAGVVNGSTPLPGAAPSSAGVKNGAKPPAASTAAPAKPTPAVSPTAKPSAASTAAPAKPAPAPPAAKPGLMSRLKAMLPGSKK